MFKNPLNSLSELGQSIWYDNISRDIIKSGELNRMIAEDDLRGVTSNPTIFEKAISGSDSYDELIEDILKENPDIEIKELYEELIIEDIKAAADILFPVYENTKGRDGYISVEVSPELAYDTKGTIEEARRLRERIHQPNLMIKVPSTDAGIPAIRQLISEGICVNVTLMFSLDDYKTVVDAYLSGLEQRFKDGKELSSVSSVASFFVSRVDTLVDKKLAAIANKEITGKIAVANSKIVYQHHLQVYEGERFHKLKKYGAQKQRLLWASTSTKNPDYSDILYVEQLLGPDTINTIPPATMDAYRDHGQPQNRLARNIEQAHKLLQDLDNSGINLSEVTQQLKNDGVKAFADSFHSLLNVLAEKRKKLSKTIHI